VGAPRSTWPSAAFAAVIAASACGHHDPVAARRVDAGVPASDTSSLAARADAGPARPAVRLHLGEIRLTDLGWDPRVSHPDEQTMRAMLDAAVGKAGLLPAEPGSDAIEARLELSTGMAFHGDAGKEDKVDAAASLRLRWKEDGRGHSMESRVVAEQELDADGRKHLSERARAALEHAVRDATVALALRDGIRRGDEKTVVAALSNDDADVRAEAFRAVSERHLVGALPRLYELLKSTNAEIRDAAIGALVELGDRGAVKPLVDMVEFNDLDMMRRIIDAVGMIGGDEARDYLEFVASGHETPVVRQLAQEALDRLKRREGAAKPASR
jgi:hypothetical protein